VRLVIARVRYKTVDADGNADVITTAMPNEMLPSSLAAPSLAANITMENIGKGIAAEVSGILCTAAGGRHERNRPCRSH
jgi:hypothetical protein